MGEYLREQYEKAYLNSIKELNDKERQWRKDHQKELQKSLNKLKSTIIQEKLNDNK